MSSPTNRSPQLRPSKGLSKLERSREDSPSSAGRRAQTHDELRPASPSVGGEDFATMKARVDSLEEDIKRRQESYIRRERSYKQRIEELENTVKKLQSSNGQEVESDNLLDGMKSSHKQIISNIEKIQEYANRMQHEQETDLLRGFRSRLFEIDKEHEKTKATTDDGTLAWIEKSHELEKALEQLQDHIQSIERVNHNLERENKLIKAQFQQQEDDRDFLIKQLVTFKKENRSLNQEKEALQKEITELKAQFQATPQLESKYKDVIRRLKRLVEQERKGARAIRKEHADNLKARSEVELILSRCIQDVRQQVLEEQAQASMGLSPSTPSSMSEQIKVGSSSIPSQMASKLQFEETETRKALIEKLLQNHQILNQIKELAFPVRNYDPLLLEVDTTVTADDIAAIYELKEEGGIDAESSSDEEAGAEENGGGQEGNKEETEDEGQDALKSTREKPRTMEEKKNSIARRLTDIEQRLTELRLERQKSMLEKKRSKLEAMAERNEQDQEAATPALKLMKLRIPTKPLSRTENSSPHKASPQLPKLAS